MADYLVVSFLEPEVPESFARTAYPLHLTLVRPFSTARSTEELLAALGAASGEARAMGTTGKSREMFTGAVNDVSVTELVLTAELQALHERLVVALQPFEFKPPLFPFRPHVTDHGEVVAVGQEVLINSVSLVEQSGDHLFVRGTLGLAP